jgi:GNAT superfamily N-acetyltransferase
MRVRYPHIRVPGGFTRPTGDLGLQLSRRTDHVETWSPPYVVQRILALYASLPVTVEVRDVVDEAGSRLSLDIWNAVYPVMAQSLADQRSYEEYCLAHVDVLATHDGKPAGSGFAGVEPGLMSRGICKALIAVLPAHRAGGTGTALYERLSSFARDWSCTELETWVLDADPAGVEFAEKRGFVEVSREQLVALELGEIDEPRLEPPPGVSIVTLAGRPELERGMYEVALEAEPDIPGFDEEIPPFEEWVQDHLRAAGDRPEATFVALAGDEVVGFAKFHLTEARPEVARHDLTGVKRAWRGQGIARALKTAEIAWAKREGYQQLVTANEVRNAPIVHLNEVMGYKPIPGRALLRGPVAQAS